VMLFCSGPLMPASLQASLIYSLNFWLLIFWQLFAVLFPYLQYDRMQGDGDLFTGLLLLYMQRIEADILGGDARKV